MYSTRAVMCRNPSGWQHLVRRSRVWIMNGFVVSNILQHQRGEHPDHDVAIKLVFFGDESHFVVNEYASRVDMLNSMLPISGAFHVGFVPFVVDLLVSCAVNCGTWSLGDLSFEVPGLLLYAN